ncbi:hypothetical protein EDF56_102564 [Novosphingobium sp. PhB165]|uniref:hypothetical protein n=1 Tax=Novosphingobium sp. PhB165 TaxID=2485105 RepID=UPI0010454644|nr:hypothetical protein [Novosphingobium sp. PhB165]TCM20900.1 hypothetical protein EDF56_102564 [Novosphingobium sp. PhB165]
MSRSMVTGVAFTLLAIAPVNVQAQGEKLRGSAGADYLPQLVEWSLSDRAGADQAKAVHFERDSGDAGWSMDFLAVKSLDPVERAVDRDSARFRGKHMSVNAWHALGGEDLVRFTAIAGRVSRRAADAVILPAKTRASYAGAELAWEHARDWSLSAGVYQQGGWGGHSMESDLLRLTNGEPVAANGLHAAWRFALDHGDAAGEPRTWLGLDGHSGNRGSGIGTGLRHASDVSLLLTTRF